MNSKTLSIPTLEGIAQAHKRISNYIPKTTTRFFKTLSEIVNAEVYIKFENHNPTCAFKVRGGINLVSKLAKSNTNPDLHLLAGSTGNHGQSIAYAGKIFNIPVSIVVPEGANSAKVKAMKELNAKIIFYGKDVFESWEYCHKLVSENGNYKFIHSVEEPDLIEGVGTIGLEVFEDIPDLDVFITAVGGGSGVCGSSIALKSINPKIQTYAIQSDGASAIHDSFRNKKLITYPSLNTFAEGLATRNIYKYAYDIMEKYVDDIFLVSDEEIKKSIVLLLEHTRNLAEGAGAASLAGLIKYKEKFKEKKVVCVLTGGNLHIDVLREILKS